MEPLIAISQRPVEDFLSEPVLTVACVLLILVGFLWIVTARVIAHNQKVAARARRERKSATRSGRTAPRAGTQAYRPRD